MAIDDNINYLTIRAKKGFYMGHQMLGDVFGFCAAAHMLHKKLNMSIKIHFPQENRKGICKYFPGVEWVPKDEIPRAIDCGLNPLLSEWPNMNGVKRFYKFMDPSLTNPLPFNVHMNIKKYENPSEKLIGLVAHSHTQGPIPDNVIVEMCQEAKKVYPDHKIVLLGESKNKFNFQLDLVIEDRRDSEPNFDSLVEQVRNLTLLLTPQTGPCFIAAGVGVPMWVYRSKSYYWDYVLNYDTPVVEKWFDRTDAVKKDEFIEELTPVNSVSEKVNIKNVTLVCVDCVDVRRSIRAIENSLEDCTFESVKLLTSLETDYKYAVKIPHISSINQYSSFIIKELYKYIDTDYMLIIQYDGWVANAKVWSEDFLKYDYIGGICNWMDKEAKGGNGGFSLRSKKLMERASKVIPDESTFPEDAVLSSNYNDERVNACIVKGYRKVFEAEGFIFADSKVQGIFSWECGRYKNTFGFHKTDLRNHPKYKKWFNIDLEYQYKKRCENISDINEHLPVISEYSSKSKTVVEFGVRGANSSYAILHGKPKKLTSYDIVNLPVAKDIEFVAEDNNIDYRFIVADTKAINIETCDMLFVDTEHTYEQLHTELCRHASNVNNYILIHDTETFDKKDRIQVDSPKKGLKLAISDFLQKTEEGKKWVVEKEFKNNNGLTVLKKVVNPLTKEKILAIYRYHDKNSINEKKIKNLNSFYSIFKKSVTENRYVSKFYLICDNMTTKSINLLKSKIDPSIEVIVTQSALSPNKFNHRGHFSFYETSLNLTKKECSNSTFENTFIFFCEDDYEYHENCIDITISQLRKYRDDFVSMYDHPDRYMYGSKEENDTIGYKPYQLELIHDSKTNHHWRTAISTCHSFAATWAGLSQLLKTSIMNKKFNDHLMWINIWKTNKHKLWTPVPGLAIHLGGPHIPLKNN